MPAAVVAIGRPDVRDVVCAQLRAEGISVRAECDDAAQLLAACEIEQPDVVVLGDGIDRWNPSVLAALRTQPVSIVALVADEGAEQVFDQAGVCTLWVFDLLAQPSLLTAAVLSAGLEHETASETLHPVVVVTGPAGSTGKTTGALLLGDLMAARVIDADRDAAIHLWHGNVSATVDTSTATVVSELERERPHAPVVIDAGDDPSPPLLRAATHLVLVATCDPISIARLMSLIPAVARPAQRRVIVLNQSRPGLGRPQALLDWLGRIDPDCEVVMVGYRRRLFDRALRRGDPRLIWRSGHVRRRWNAVADAVTEPSMACPAGLSWETGIS